MEGRPLIKLPNALLIDNLLEQGTISSDNRLVISRPMRNGELDSGVYGLLDFMVVCALRDPKVITERLFQRYIIAVAGIGTEEAIEILAYFIHEDRKYGMTVHLRNVDIYIQVLPPDSMDDNWARSTKQDLEEAIMQVRICLKHVSSCRVRIRASCFVHQSVGHHLLLDCDLDDFQEEWTRFERVRKAVERNDKNLACVQVQDDSLKEIWNSAVGTWRFGLKEAAEDTA